MPSFLVTETDRICAATLAGRFGVRPILASELRDIVRRQASADLDIHHRLAAPFTTARRRGTEQGNEYHDH